MKYQLFTLFLLASISSHGQAITPFTDSAFPATKFTVKKEQRTLGTVTIDIINTKPIKPGEPKQFMCRTWLMIKDKNNLVKEVGKDVEGVGGCSGLFFPEKQPNKDLVIISKFGDYDGRLYIVNARGEFKSYPGGTFYVSGDGKYLFSNYDSDLSGVTVIDLTKNELVYTGELEQYLADWYYRDGQYFAVVNDDVKVPGETGLLLFDFTTKSFKERRTKEKIDPNNKLQAYNDYKRVPDCSCGK